LSNSRSSRRSAFDSCLPLQPWLGAPTATAALHDDLEHHKQLVLDLAARIEELDEELAAAREANRGLMGELSRL
jgi:hypothetical protein